MTLRLTVDAASWQAHVDRIASDMPGLVPVVKGNGYGFGRPGLAEIAAGLADTIAVGTVYELEGLPAGITPIVLTPTLAPPSDAPAVAPVLTVGSLSHVRALHGWTGRVLVKLASSVHRYGVDPDELAALTTSLCTARLEILGFSIHPPVSGPDDEHLDDITAWLDRLDPRHEVWVSHLSPSAYGELRVRWPDRRFRIRLGTALWHGDKRALHLAADVIDVRPVAAGQRAGYRQTPVPIDGQLVMIGCGTAHGVHPLPDGSSPFHFDRRRLPLLEPSHMHTSMVVVPTGWTGPDVGDLVDVQRPLISTMVDEVVWS